MSDTITSPNMNLPVPVVSTDPGPDWANNLNACLSILDGHNHSPGSGIQINPSGININADLPFNDNNAISLRSTRFDVSASPLATPVDLACAYGAGTAGDLYWNDLNGNKIQITASGGVAGSQGSIAGLTAPASATYVSATGTFVWKSASTVAANMDFATGIFRYNGSYPTPSGSNWISVEVPSSIAAGYALTLPAAPPAATSFVTMDTSGNLATRTITAPTVQKFTPGSGTYVTPGGVLYIQVKMVGAGGGGGGGGGAGATDGSAGSGPTTFGTSLLVCNVGGAGGANAGGGGAGGTALLGSGPVGSAFTGGFGAPGVTNISAAVELRGAPGASTPFGGGGLGGTLGSSPEPTPNSGAGGSGGGGAAQANTGGGGGAGGYIDAIITNPLSTYAYSIGSGGAAGTPLAGNGNGTAGADGYIEVREFYQ